MDNTLFYYLAGLGVVVLGGLVAHGVWQARKASPRRAEVPEPPRPREQVEPTMDGEMPPDVDGATLAADLGISADPADRMPIDPALPTTATPAQADSVVTPSTFAAGDDAAPLAAAVAEAGAAPNDAWLLPRRKVLRIDALVDAIAVLTLDAPVAGEFLLTHLPPSRRAGGKPFMVEGLSTETGEWEAPAPNRRYSELQAGVLLANRTGPINEIEYSEFVHKVQAMADAIGAATQFPDMLEVVAQARELDAFASQHDAQLAVHLRSPAVAWSVGYIHQQAARHGFVAGATPGRLVVAAQEEGAPPVLVLSFDPQAALAEDPNMAAVHDLTLSFDVPQTDAAREPFAEWHQRAQALARDMDAVVVDDKGHPIGPGGFDMIGSELKHLYEALDARGLSAGSTPARRLFS